jgi:hypothetical protein
VFSGSQLRGGPTYERGDLRDIKVVAAANISIHANLTGMVRVRSVTRPLLKGGLQQVLKASTDRTIARVVPVSRFVTSPRVANLSWFVRRLGRGTDVDLGYFTYSCG